jgi:hypothetical protein
LAILANSSEIIKFEKARILLFAVERLQNAGYSMGQAVFVRTDTPDFAEYGIPFTSLDEMVRICSNPPGNATLDRVIVSGDNQGAPFTLTLSFVSVSGLNFASGPNI